MRPATSPFTLPLLAAVLIGGAAGTRSASAVRPAHPCRGAAVPAAADGRARLALLAELPAAFEPNVGQAGHRVRFLSRSRAGILSVSATESVLTLPAASQAKGARPEKIRMKLVGANPAAPVSGAEKLPGIVSYFAGRDPSAWKTRVPTYAKVRCCGAYPGIDLVYYGREGVLEYDFAVKPGADPGRIRLAADGADAVTLDPRGDLVLRTRAGELRHHRPVAYQVVDGRRILVPARFRLFRTGKARSHEGVWEYGGVGVWGRPWEVSSPRGGAGRSGSGGSRSAGSTTDSDDGPLLPHSHTPTQIGFELAAYDRTRPLVIDPVLTYSTFLGGTSNEEAYGLTVDVEGAVYVTGRANSVDFPVGANPGAFPADPDSAGFAGAFVTKINPAGTALVYTTFFGHSSQGTDVAVNADGVAYVTGFTNNGNFPTTSGAFQTGLVLVGRRPQDAFVTAIAADGGSLVYSTLLGGGGGEFGMGIAVDANGQACITGLTGSPTAGLEGGPFPTHNAAQTGLGHGGTDIPDAFVAKFNATGSALVFSTYLGGSQPEGDNGIIPWYARIAVDGSGNVYVAGITQSPDFPLLNAVDSTFAGLQEAFVAKYTPTGQRVYATFLGGSERDFGGAIAVDPAGNAYVTGNTQSTDFPLLNPMQSTFGGGGSTTGDGDSFVTKLDPSGALVFSTFLGGSSGEQGTGIALDGTGRIYLCGRTNSADFPLVAPLPGMSEGGPYLARMRADGSGLLFSSYFAGTFSRLVNVFDVAAGPGGSLVACGYTSDDEHFPIVNALQPVYGGFFEDCFLVRVDPSPPAVTLSSPAQNAAVGSPVTIQAGITGDTEVTWQVLLDHAAQGSGSGNTVSLQRDLAQGPHTVEVRATDADGRTGTSGERPFTVLGPPPAITSLSPTSGTQGQQDLSVLISGGGFKQGATVSFGTGITVESAVVSKGPGVQIDHQLTVVIDIAQDAPPGARTVMVVNPDGQQATKESAFTVNAAPPGPALRRFTLSPTQVKARKPVALNVMLTGAAPTGGAQVTFTSSNPAVAAPPEQTIPAGAKKLKKPFQWKAPAVSSEQTATITASYGGVSKTAEITVRPKGRR